MYLALQKGIVDAVANVWDASHVFKLNEVSKCVNELYLMSSTHIEAWNKKTWEELTEMERLQKELEYFRAENAVLKKLRDYRLRDEAKRKGQQKSFKH